MTNNEAIEGLQFLKAKLYNGIYGDCLECIDVAINVLRQMDNTLEPNLIGHTCIPELVYRFSILSDSDKKYLLRQYPDIHYDIDEPIDILI